MKSVGYALKGYRWAFKWDTNFRLEALGGLLFLAFGYVLWPLKPYELLFLCLSYTLIITAELINTAFERALEKLHPGHDELIGVSKDIAAAAVLSAGIFAAIVWLIIAMSHIRA